MPPSSKMLGLLRRPSRPRVPRMFMAPRQAMLRTWRTPSKPMRRPIWQGRLFRCVFLKTSAVVRRPRWSG
eukprot:3328873-Lingulodinium_polyedra.AAC.1